MSNDHVSHSSHGFKLGKLLTIKPVHFQTVNSPGQTKTKRNCFPYSLTMAPEPGLGIKMLCVSLSNNLPS